MRTLIKRCALAVPMMLAYGGVAMAETVAVGALAAAPVVDGVADDWAGVAVTEIAVSGPLGIGKVSLKAGTHGDRVYILAQWADSTMDDQHKPFIWDEKAGKYETGSHNEDRFAIQFAMDGEYDADWLSGKAFKADTWHWKAARSNGLGLAQDKMTIVTLDVLKKAYKGTSKDGKTVYIDRPADAGDKFYTTARYRDKEGEVMPKYILSPNPQGSVADVAARGVWKDGQWTLEFSRKLDTGHPDDVAFAAGQAVKGGLAVFNQSGDDQHDASATLTFQY